MYSSWFHGSWLAFLRTILASTSSSDLCQRQVTETLFVSSILPVRLLQCCSRRSKVIVPVCMFTLYLCCWVCVHVFRRRKHTVKRECRQTQGHDCCRWQRCQEIFERLPACSCFMQALSRHQSTKHCDGFLFCYVDVGTQQHHAFHHPPTPPSHTLQVRWSLLKLVGAVVTLHVNQVQLASWRNMVRLIACGALFFGLAHNYKRQRDENSWPRIQTMPFQNSCVLGAVCTSCHRSPVLSRLLFKSVWNLM